ncbi:MAG: VOC family protein [Candidatus Hodarchaeales archaeon]|jgi:predicted enzyme related to lactoylglutathione lyase
MKNTICHVEIPITNKEKANSFYKKVFNWEINFNQLPNYGLASYDKDVSIGFPINENTSKLNLNFYIKVEEMSKTFEKVLSSGGTIVAEKQLISSDIGFSGKFEDCFGNQIGLFSSK